MHITALFNGAINKYRLLTQQFKHIPLQENNTFTQIHIAMKAVMGDRPKHSSNMEK
jgi:hypothetical protein